VLAITGNHPDYPASTVDYSYGWDVCGISTDPYHTEGRDLTIDGEPVYDEVLDKIMFLGDEANPSAKVFIRIN
jgi:hypothetical protein